MNHSRSPILIIICVFLTGCNQQSQSGSQPGPRSPAEKARNLTNNYAANPFHPLSKAAQGLKYPPGVDTVVFWGNGRFNVILDYFNDEEAKNRASFKVRMMRQEGSLVYFAGDQGFLILDLAAATNTRFATKQELPGELVKPFARLEDTNDAKNLVFDPKTRMPLKNR